MSKATELIQARQLAKYYLFLRECENDSSEAELLTYTRALISQAKAVLPDNRFDLVFILATRNIKFLAECNTYHEAETRLNGLIAGTFEKVELNDLEEIRHILANVVDAERDKYGDIFTWNGEDMYSVLDENGVIGVYRWSEDGESTLVEKL